MATRQQIEKDVRYWQRLLRFGGYDPGAVDGIMGPKTRAAAERWDVEATKERDRHSSFDSRSEENLASLLPEAQGKIRQWMELAVPRATELGVEVRLICGTRTYAEQDAEYAKGRTAPGAKVTNARGGYSWHNFGLAADFGVFKGKTYLADGPQYDELGRLARQIPGLEWGGDWTSFKDRPHIQLVKYGSVAAARAKF